MSLTRISTISYNPFICLLDYIYSSAGLTAKRVLSLPSEDTVRTYIVTETTKQRPNTGARA